MPFPTVAMGASTCFATNQNRSSVQAAGCLIALDKAGNVSCKPALQDQTAPDIGAEAENSPTVQYFRAHDTGVYSEPPRIVGLSIVATGQDLGVSASIMFSTPIRVNDGEVRAELEYDMASLLPRSEPCQVSGHRLSCPIAPDVSLPNAPMLAVRLSAGIIGPTGLAATSWGGAPELVRIVE